MAPRVGFGGGGGGGLAAPVALADLATQGQSTIVGRAAGAGTGVPVALTVAQAQAILGLLATSVDNVVPRFNGTAGGTQGSGLTIDDLANGAGFTIKSVTEEITIAETPSSDSANTTMVPLRRLILGASTIVNTQPGGTTSFTVGINGAASLFCSASISSAPGTTHVCAGTAIGGLSAAATLSVRITPNTTPSDALGRIRVTLYYIEPNALTS